MSYTRQEFTDNKTILKAEHLQHIEDGIISLESAIDNLGGVIEDVVEYGIITQQSKNVTLHAGYVSGSSGTLSANADYDSWSFTVDKDCLMYVGAEEKIHHDYFSLSVIPSGATKGVRYRYNSSDDTLPTVDSPLSVAAGSTIYISIKDTTVYWSVYTDLVSSVIDVSLKEAIKDNQLILQHTYISDTMQNLLILKKCGNHDNLFLGQNFVKLVGDNNVNCWRLSTVAAWKRVGNEFCFYKGNMIIAGEWECAIKESGAADFVGGNAHGDENLISIYANLDGKALDFSTNFTITGYNLEIIRNSILDRCDTPGDNVMKHLVRYHIIPESITIYQSIEFLQEMVLESSYLLMAPVAREYTNWGYVDTHNEIVDISSAGHSKPGIDGNKGHYSMWNDNFSIQVEFECHEGYFKDAFSFISPSTNPPYNKIYHNFVGTGVQHTAPVGHKISQTNKYIYNYNE